MEASSQLQKPTVLIPAKSYLVVIEYESKWVPDTCEIHKYTAWSKYRLLNVAENCITLILI